MKSRARPSPKRAYDGSKRAARAAETRGTIAECAIRLYREKGADGFTLDDVAACAGVTVQTVLRGFSSKDTLVLEGLSRLGRAGDWIVQTEPGDAGQAVRAIFEFYEALGDLVIRQLADESRYPSLRTALAEGRRHHRAWVERVFGGMRRVEGTQREGILRLIDVATDVYVWKLLRRDMKLPRAAAEEAMRRLVESVVREEQRDGENPVAELVGRRQSPAQPRRRTHRDRART